MSRMDRNVQQLLNRVSFVCAAVATLFLLHLFTHPSCRPLSPSAAALLHLRPLDPASSLTLSRTPFPRSSCEVAARRPLPPDKRVAKLRSSGDWLRKVASFSSAVFQPLRDQGLLFNSSHVLCVAAGAGHEVDALLQSGVSDVTGVELVDFPPLVRRSDPHNLPFFDGVFDLGFSTGVEGALFPRRFVAEMERTVRKGGVSVLAFGRFSSEVEAVRSLFRRSSLVGVRNVTLIGADVTVLIMRNNGIPP